MGHDKLRKFAENKLFACLLQPDAGELLAEGYFALKDHPVKGHWTERFGREGELVLELGCGKGEYTLDQARRNPGQLFVGVDIKGARLWKGAKEATASAMPNVAFLRTRIEFIQAFFAPGEVSGIWLTFPDPQMRKENARLTAPVFLERYRQFLRPGGTVRLKTDSRFLYQYTLALCRANNLSVKVSCEDLYGGDRSLDASLYEVQTFYEKMFLAQGYKIFYLEFTLDHDGPLVSPPDFDADYWRSVEGHRQLFGRDTAETRRQKLHAAAKACLLAFLLAVSSFLLPELRAAVCRDSGLLHVAGLPAPEWQAADSLAPAGRDVSRSLAPYTCGADVVYGWNTGLSHYGGVLMDAFFPLHRNFEGQLGLHALYPGVAGGSLLARPVLPLSVGALFAELDARGRYFGQWRLVESNAALRVGYRMDYVCVQLGLMGLWLWDVPPSGQAVCRQEPVQWQYLLACWVRPASSRWNLGVGGANFDEWACYRTFEPALFLRGQYDFSDHLRLRARLEWRPAGMFHMAVSSYGAQMRLGMTYRF